MYLGLLPALFSCISSPPRASPHSAPGRRDLAAGRAAVWSGAVAYRPRDLAPERETGARSPARPPKPRTAAPAVGHPHWPDTRGCRRQVPAAARGAELERAALGVAPHRLFPRQLVAAVRLPILQFNAPSFTSTDNGCTSSPRAPLQGPATPVVDRSEACVVASPVELVDPAAACSMWARSSAAPGNNAPLI